MRNFRAEPEKHTSEAKAHSYFAAFTARLKSCPDTNQRFPAVGCVSLTVWIKGAQALALAVAVCFSLGATDAGSRYNNLNHRLMCTCGCAEILGECNHVGCPASGQELAELRAGINAGQSDQEILASFAAKYGATVLAAPTTHGFDLVAWIAPFAVFAAALLGTILLIRRWANSPAGKTEAAAKAADPATEALREQIRRETGDDGGI
jgi:cytochrome c-type biogenesis protein CcmH